MSLFMAKECWEVCKADGFQELGPDGHRIEEVEEEIDELEALANEYLETGRWQNANNNAFNRAKPAA